MLATHRFSLPFLRYWPVRRCTRSHTSTMNRFGEYSGDCVWLKALLRWNTYSIPVMYTLKGEALLLKVLRTKLRTCCWPIPITSVLFHSPYPLLAQTVFARESMQAISFSAASTAPCCNATTWYSL